MSANECPSRMPAVDRYAEIRAAHRWDVPPDFNLADSLLRPLGGRPRALRAVLGGRDGRAPRSPSGTCSSRRIGCRTRSRRRRRARRPVALILPQRPETSSRTSRCYQLGAVAVPLSFLFGPEALEYRLQNSAGEGRDRRSAIAAESRCRSATAARRCAHVIGVAGATRARDRQSWESLQTASRQFTRVATRATIPRCSSTPAARPARRRAR